MRINNVKIAHVFYALFFLVIEAAFLSPKAHAQCNGIDFKAITPTKGCPLLIVKFAAIGTSSSAGTTFKWDFGNGYINGNDTITAAFSTQGQYTIKMQATLSGSSTPCTVVKDTFITVYAQPTPIISSNAGFSFCNFTSGTKIILTDNTLNETSREWIVNNKTSAAKTDTISFPISGSYNVSLYSSNKYGCEGFTTQVIQMLDSVPVDICASFNVTPNGTTGVFTPEVGDTGGSTVTSYSWTFFGGMPSSSTSKFPPEVSYSDPTKKYDVLLSISTSNGCTYTRRRKAFVSPFLTPAFQTECASGFQVNADTTDPHKGFWKFNFPNGTVTPTCKTCATPPLILSYPQGGTYAAGVKYQYTNGLGCDIKVNYPFFVKALGPRVAFSSADNQICKIGDTVHFINGSDTTNAGSVKYTWYIFDSTDTKLLASNNVIGPTSNYDTFYRPASLGKFGVSLVATNLNGCRDSINKNQFISHAKLPKPDFYVTTPTFYCAPAIGIFVNTTKNSDSETSYIWNFGDGTSFSTPDSGSVSHIYHHFDKTKYTVTLTALTPHGCGQTVTKNAIDITGPVPRFTMDQRTGCDSLTVHFTNVSKNVKKFYFLNGDGSPPDSVNLSAHKYVLNDPNQDSIFFYPTLLSIGDSVCSDYFKDTVKIYRHCTNGVTSIDNSQVDFSVYPNPFQSSISVKYELTVTSNINLSLFDITGRQLGTIINENQVPGAYTFEVDAGKYKLTRGIYIIKFMAGGNVISRQLVKF